MIFLNFFQGASVWGPVHTKSDIFETTRFFTPIHVDGAINNSGERRVFNRVKKYAASKHLQIHVYRAWEFAKYY